MTTQENGAKQTLTPADQTPAPEPEERRLAYSVKLYAVAPQGYVVEIMTADAERPVNWIATLAEGLERLHYTPIDPYAPATVDVDVAAPQAAAAAPGVQGSGEATWIKGDNGAPPECSIHGVAKYVKGEYKQDHAKAGQKYAFWACSYNTTAHPCRPKGEPA